MALADLVRRWDVAGRLNGAIEYGSDGSPFGGFQFTPWTGVINDGAGSGFVTEDVAEGLPGVGRGVELIAGVVSQLDPLLMTGEFNTTTPTRVRDTPTLLQDPDPEWHGRSAWLSAVTTSLAWHGNSFAYRGPEVSDFRGYPLRLPLFTSQDVSWQTDPPRYVVNGIDVDRGDMVHMVIGAKAGYKMGTGILARYQRELRLMLATEQAQFVLMSEGRPVGIVSTNMDLTPGEAEQAKSAFLKAMATSGIAVMAGADFKGVQWNSNDLAMVPSREFNLRLASDIVGVPPYLLGVPSESRVYSNMENEWANFVRVTLGRYLSAIEAGLTRCFPKGKTVRFDLDQLLRGDSSARWNVYEKAISLGVASPQEVRNVEGWPEAAGAGYAGAPVQTEPVVQPDDTQEEA